MLNDFEQSINSVYSITLHDVDKRSLLLLLDLVSGLFDENGKLLGSSSSPIQIWKEGDCVEVMLVKLTEFC